ncbi:glycoside hydrolase family 10 protein [Pseudothermotoga lettingae]|uniref:Glycosyl hydrolase-like 10 domain-containing protein n=1 Tax=Pseudothermotoga lettingae (strain ATCC BAA-301 / DSM 14385 / NBRC 107922 / TMO) TaxID=416591 RepID=A8F7U2_PSELT|nr:family 10 glycosylhydrolase [Pseudothermotoga lettingae]ABV34226.1 protein of unknown function DUF187 [Pseudothermotoga lettingae TMO]GLI48830.1 hypothetical protein PLETTINGATMO_09990 [Pseudothermotoga lettingae TMO]
MARKVNLFLVLLVTTTLMPYPLGIWVVRDQITSIEKINRVIEIAKEVGATRIYVQVVGRADAYYNSEILPKAETLSECSPDFDPLKEIIDLAKISGIKISAWMNVFYAWPFGKKPVSEKHVVNVHPDWITYDQNGKSMLEYASSPEINTPGLFLEPALEDVKKFVSNIAEEIAKNYDVDEIHLDYIRYPYKTFGYHPDAMKIYREWLKKAIQEKKLTNLGEGFDLFRIQQVSDTVKLIYEKVHNYGKKLSAAVFAYYEQDAISQRLQGWLQWLEGEYLDYACLMAYENNRDTVEYYVKYAVKALGAAEKIRVGLGAYKMTENPEKLYEIAKSVVEKYRPDEILIFSFENLLDEKVRKYVADIARLNF